MSNFCALGCSRAIYCATIVLYDANFNNSTVWSINSASKHTSTM